MQGTRLAAVNRRGLNSCQFVGRTTIVIAPLSTIEHADRIVVLAQGRIIESGRHWEILARDGLYRHLLSWQRVDENNAVNSRRLRFVR
jgi:ABC-type transport system involved in Fe-S cluster assembly fused permease/ATPase subunit